MPCGASWVYQRRTRQVNPPFADVYNPPVHRLTQKAKRTSHVAPPHSLPPPVPRPRLVHVITFHVSPPQPHHNALGFLLEAFKPRVREREGEKTRRLRLDGGGDAEARHRRRARGRRRRRRHTLSPDPRSATHPRGDPRRPWPLGERAAREGTAMAAPRWIGPLLLLLLHFVAAVAG